MAIMQLILLYEKTADTIQNLEVVTCSKQNPVWKFSTEHKLLVRQWPPELKQYEFDLGLVVSFGYLIPESIINKFPLGMLNVHGSLLPRWRGASPITYAIAKGDQETGITIMQIRPDKFDTGEVICQEKVTISPETEFPELYEKLGKIGANCLVDIVRNIDECLTKSAPQSQDGVTYAPKLTPEFGQVRWAKMSAREVYNLHRALKSVFPLKTTWNSMPVKLLDVAIWTEHRISVLPGHVEYSKKNKILIIECADSTWISVKNVGVHKKKSMSALDFYNGFISKLDKNVINRFE